VIDRDYCEELSHNCRLDTLQAAVLLKRLARYPAGVKRRREIAARYGRELAGIVATPPVVQGYEDAIYTYTIRTPRRNELHDRLAEVGIETRIQHPLTMNDQPAFQGKYRGSSPRAHRLVQEILCLPANEKLTDPQQDFVIASVRSFFAGA
jgi:dTDP-4-amino-4,6-dideoxygalactose transaminase